jgi:uncharacterized membrane protein
MLQTPEQDASAEETAVEILSLIPADNAIAVMAGLLVVAAIGFLAEKTRIGALLTGAVVAILLAIAASNVPVPILVDGELRFDVPLMPKSSGAYSFVFSYFVPLLIPLFLIKADLKKMIFETGRLTLAFLLAAVATVLGAVIAVAVLPLPFDEAGVAGVFTATYIGGSVNFAALLDVTGLRENSDFFAASVAADNIASALFLGVLAILPGLRWLASRFVERDHSHGEVVEDETGKATAMSLTLTIAFALVVVAVADALTALGAAQFGDWFGNWRYAIITVLALIPATAFPKTMGKLQGGYELGIGLAFVFFAAIAAGADVDAMIRLAPILMALVAILLSVHALVLFGLGSLLRFSLPELITASNAAILGATTAPALAAAKGWKDLVTPGVLVGVLGYVIGTIIATGVYQFWPS